jgi:regulator of RNase E activity RraA
LVVADGDGVIVVPRKLVDDVAKYAWQEASADKKSRKKMYLELNIPLDETVDVEL